MRVSKETQRRFVLGMQGLWPGRRWKGAPGTKDAIVACRRIRVDPLDVVGRSQDLAFLGRVDGYRKDILDRVLYGERAAFEHGGAVSIYPRELLRLHRSWVRNEGLPLRWEKWYSRNSEVVRRVKNEVESNGPLESRDYEGERVQDYRSSRIEGLALYYLWRHFDVLIHHRVGKRKFYDLTERMFGVLPGTFTNDETLREMACETMSWLGLSGKEGVPFLRTNEDGRGRARVTKLETRQKLVHEGLLREVEVEGERQTAVLRTEVMDILEEVASGEVPKPWKPMEEQPETIFMAPLDVTIASGRSQTLFGFEYLWEVYKPANKRRWGYYVLPVLFGDQLVGRIEPVFDLGTKQLRVVNAWWEERANLKQLPGPFALGLCRLADFLGARSVALENTGPPKFKTEVSRVISSRIPQPIN